MNQNRSSTWLIVLGIGCAVILCIALVIIIIASFFVVRQRTVSTIVTDMPAVTVDIFPFTDTPVPTEESSLVPPTDTPVATNEPTQPEATLAPSFTPTLEPTITEVTDPGLALTGDQELTEYSLFDDFSSDALQWPIYDDGKTVFEYADDAYHMQILEPDYFDWAYFPVDFVPYEIWFDVTGASGPQDGTFGVFCHFEDIDNYYYVEFDLEIDSYIIGQAVGGEYLYLTEENSDGGNWQTTTAFTSSPSDTNQIGVMCYLESITVFINNQMVDDVSVTQPHNEPGEAAFFVYAFDFIGENGYQIWIDNVETYEPQQ
jgi:hypothetical protein